MKEINYRGGISMIKKHIVKAFILCLVICLIATAFLVWPRRINTSLTLNNSDGDSSIEIMFDATLHRHLKKGTQLKGKVVIDGVEYDSVDNLYADNCSVFLVPNNNAIARWEKSALITITGYDVKTSSILLASDEAVDTYRLEWSK